LGLLPALDLVLALPFGLVFGPFALCAFALVSVFFCFCFFVFIVFLHG
jgi:hypothetical protein